MAIEFHFILTLRNEGTFEKLGFFPSDCFGRRPKSQQHFTTTTFQVTTMDAVGFSPLLRSLDFIWNASVVFDGQFWLADGTIAVVVTIWMEVLKE